MKRRNIGEVVFKNGVRRCYCCSRSFGFRLLSKSLGKIGPLQGLRRLVAGRKTCSSAVTASSDLGPPIAELEEAFSSELGVITSFGRRIIPSELVLKLNEKVKNGKR